MRKNRKNKSGRHLKNRTEFLQQPAHKADSDHIQGEGVATDFRSFCVRFIQAVKEATGAHDWQFEPIRFQLVSTSGNVIKLGEIYEDYCGVPPPHQELFLATAVLTHCGSATELPQRRRGVALAKSTAKDLATRWRSELRGAGRLLSIGMRFVFGHDGNPEQDGPAKNHSAILDQVFFELGIHTTGFGVHENTWCRLIACSDMVHDDQLEKIVNAARILAVGQSNHPLKKAVARVKRQLDGGRQTNVTAGGARKKVDQSAAQVIEHRTPRVATALG